MADAFSETRDAFSKINLAFSASRSRRYLYVCGGGGGGEGDCGDGGDGGGHARMVEEGKIMVGHAYKFEGSLIALRSDSL